MRLQIWKSWAPPAKKNRQSPWGVLWLFPSMNTMFPFNWQQSAWPSFTCARTALREELDAFARAFREARKALSVPEDP